MSLLTKEISSLSADELNELSKPLGVEGIPYPELTIGADGKPDLQMSGYIPVQSVRPYEDVVALAYSNMAVPSLLEAERKIMEKMNPASSSFFTLVLSGPGWGKTSGIYNISSMMDDRPRPAVFVNAANRNLEELLWETVIDFGEDYKTAIYTRMKNGELKPESVKILEEQFKDALLKNGEGKIVGIDEGKLTQNSSFKSSSDALEDALKHLKRIADNEGIPLQTQNSIGMRKVFNSALEKAMNEGRILIWDEFTKDEQGTEAPLLEFVQWANGMGPDTITLRCTFSVNGRDETAERVLSRKNRAAGFQVVATGNYLDPMLQRAESSPIFSRMDIARMDEPEKVDWEHRISQFLTGTALSTHYAFFSCMAQDDPEEFAALLVEWREKKFLIEGGKPPFDQLTRLRNWEQTRKAVEKIGESFDYIKRLFDTNSDLHIKDVDATTPLLDDVRNELCAGFAETHPVDPRLIERLIQEADSGRNAPVKIDPDNGVVPVFNHNALRSKSYNVARDPMLAAATFGTRLEKAIERWVLSVTAGIPATREKIKTELMNHNVAFTVPDNENAVANLLNQDMYTEIGGIKSVISLRESLVARLKQANPDLKGKTDDEIMPMDQAVAACEELTHLASEVANNKAPRTGHLIILGKDPSHIFNRVSAVDGIGTQDKPVTAELVSTSDFLESLRIPAVANTNMKNLWCTTLTAENLMESVKDIAPAVQIAEGTSASKVGLTTVMMQGANDNDPVPVHIMMDETRKRGLIVTDEVDAKTKAQLGNDFTIVTYDDTDAENQVAAFIRETQQHPSRKATAAGLEKQLIRAFTLRAGNEGDPKPLAQMMTTRTLPVDAPIYMVNKPMSV